MRPRRGDEPTKDEAGAGPGAAAIRAALLARGYDWATAGHAKSSGWTVAYGFAGMAGRSEFRARSMGEVMRRIERGEV